MARGLLLLFSSLGDVIGNFVIGKATYTCTDFEGLLPRRKVFFLIIEIQCKNDTKAPEHTYKGLITRRIIAKREVRCQQDEYPMGSQCCKKCNRGHVKTIDCPTDISEHCVLCESGKEYMDHENQDNKCKRCDSCDNVLGFEASKNCTPEENTECTCAKNHFCHSEPCAYCNPCTICESGVIEKPCSSTSDTVCGRKDNVPKRPTEKSWWAVALVIILLLLTIAGAVLWCKRKQKGRTRKENLVTKTEVSYENVPLVYADVDLSNHIAGIVEEMTLQDVKTFVRNHKVPEPVIDQTVRDYPTDTSEQKIKLFQVWYQRHGIKGAYGSLINSLREFKMCTAADKIEEKLKATVASYQEGGQSHSDDTEQSKTCTEESRNSYKGSAELNKTYSDSSEEIQNRVI